MIKNINVLNDGYVLCRSENYTASDTMNDTVNYVFTPKINMLKGDIDGGMWAVSYLLSMYAYRPDDFVLFKDAVAVVDGKIMSITDLSEISCYMDKSYPLFSTDTSIKELVTKGLRENNIGCSAERIRKLFRLDHEIFERPISCVGNAVFRAMAAVGFSHKKEIYCFPWLSKSRFDGYHANMTVLLEVLESLNKIAIVPVGLTDSDTSTSYFRKPSTIERDKDGVMYFNCG